MNFNTGFEYRQMSIEQLLTLVEQGNIDTEPEWQRNIVWSTEGRALLVKSVMSGYPIAPVILWERPNGNFVCVDGKNRIEALKSFWYGIDMGSRQIYTPIEIEAQSDIGHQKINKPQIEKLLEDVNVADSTKTYLRNMLNNFKWTNLMILMLRENQWNESQVQEYFQLVQEGRPLNTEEKLTLFLVIMLIL
jgi:hypothetical protein